MRKEEIENTICEKMAKVLNTNASEIDKEKSFELFGIDSITAVRMVGELEDFLDIDLPSSLLWDHNNVSKLSEHLLELTEN